MAVDFIPINETMKSENETTKLRVKSFVKKKKKLIHKHFQEKPFEYQ